MRTGIPIWQTNHQKEYVQEPCSGMHPSSQITMTTDKICVRAGSIQTKKFFNCTQVNGKYRSSMFFRKKKPAPSFTRATSTPFTVGFIHWENLQPECEPINTEDRFYTSITEQTRYLQSHQQHSFTQINFHKIKVYSGTVLG